MHFLLLTASILSIFRWVPGLCYSFYTFYQGGDLLQGLLAFVVGYLASCALSIVLIALAAAFSNG